MAGKRPVRSRGENAPMVPPAAAAPADSARFTTRTEATPTTPTVPAGAVGAPAINAVRLEADVARVIRSKIQPPPLRDATLSRERLLHRLKSATERRLTLVVAEGGYGKTTLLTEFSSRSYVRCLWYKLDSNDRDAVTLVNYLVAAGREIKPEFGAATSQLLAQIAAGQASGEDVATSLLSELDEFGDAPTLVILDDFHTIDDSPEAVELVSRLLRDAPSAMRFVISSRKGPSMRLARLLAMGEVAEVDSDHLRFSRDETRQLFAETYGQPLDPDVLTEVDSRTEGWAASLQLLYSSIRGRPAGAARSLAHALSGATSPVYDFLAEEVIGHLPVDLELFLVRAAVLDRITPQRVVALFPNTEPPITNAHAMTWIAEADNLGLLSRGSQTSEARQFHPLLREFLLRHLTERVSAEDVRNMHRRVAEVTEAVDPLASSHHYIEAGLPGEAMRCVGQSVVLTMGSGRWGTAAQLISRLSASPAEPALAAIQARRLFEEGDIAGAAALLTGTDTSDQPAAVRAVLRQTRISMGWRSGDSSSLSETLQEIGDDPETPSLLRDIAQVFVDSSPSSTAPAPFPELAKRLERMAEAQGRAGYDYYAAISLHNAAIAQVSSGNFREALRLGSDALKFFDRLEPTVPTRYSSHAVLATSAIELGLIAEAQSEISIAVSSDSADGDVHAECGFLTAATGHHAEARRLLAAADRLRSQGRSDLSGLFFGAFAEALLLTPTRPSLALRILDKLPVDVPLDLGLGLQHQFLTALSLLADGETADAIRVALAARSVACQRGARSYEVRLALVVAIAKQDGDEITAAILDAASVGEMALLETADAVGEALHLLTEQSSALSKSVEQWPSRWLPVLRRQLEGGDTPSAHVAATLLDQHGAPEDVGRLRAYEKTYRKRRATGLGRALVHRVSPTLEVLDLGRVTLAIGNREVALSSIRRKPASLLMYLATRAKFTATREQVLDELWPDNDPGGASNSLNQSLYFIRREVDPWYEDDVSADYIHYEAELLWLDPSLTLVASAEFVASARAALTSDVSSKETLSLVERYTGQFSPEFEYEEWAIAWRSRVHASFLGLANAAIVRLFERGDPVTALAIAHRAFAVDPEALDIEHRLIWLFWHSGAKSAAQAQYEHYSGRHKSDGLEPLPLDELVGRSKLP